MSDCKSFRAIYRRSKTKPIIAGSRQRGGNEVCCMAPTDMFYMYCIIREAVEKVIDSTRCICVVKERPKVRIEVEDREKLSTTNNARRYERKTHREASYG